MRPKEVWNGVNWSSRRRRHWGGQQASQRNWSSSDRKSSVHFVALGNAYVPLLWSCCVWARLEEMAAWWAIRRNDTSACSSGFWKSRPTQLAHLSANTRTITFISLGPFIIEGRVTCMGVGWDISEVGCCWGETKNAWAWVEAVEVAVESVAGVPVKLKTAWATVISSVLEISSRDVIPMVVDSAVSSLLRFDPFTGEVTRWANVSKQSKTLLLWKYFVDLTLAGMWAPSFFYTWWGIYRFKRSHFSRCTFGSYNRTFLITLTLRNMSHCTYQQQQNCKECCWLAGVEELPWAPEMSYFHHCWHLDLTDWSW